MSQTDKTASAGMTEQYQDVLAFWQAYPQHWFAKNTAFDRTFRARFLSLHMAIARRQRETWLETAEGCLALIIMTDQFPRNAFRGTAHMYATDPLALWYARQAVRASYQQLVAVDMRSFLFLPFAHSENPDDQTESVRLNGLLGKNATRHAQRHRDIIDQFGRFPHRNSLLMRDTTPAERRFLDTGGFTG